MATERFDTVVIGAGQAGLNTGYHLRQAGRSFVILDAHERVGDNWRERYDWSSPPGSSGRPSRAASGRRAVASSSPSRRSPTADPGLRHLGSTGHHVRQACSSR